MAWNIENFNEPGPDTMIDRLTTNADYLSWVEDQENTLRFNIERNSTIIEYRYFLILLLIASKQYKKARKECQKILYIYPNNSIARSLDNMFWSEELLACSPDRTNEPKKRKVLNPWMCCDVRKNRGH